MATELLERPTRPAGTSSPYHLLIPGRFVIVGKEPDGDSVRFIADDADLFSSLRGGHRVRVSKDGSVQLRFEAVDAPELHYGSAAQPLGATARDTLLGWMGFDNITYEGASTKVAGANPDSIEGAILSKAVEVNGRPVSFVLLADDAPPGHGGDWVELSEAVLKATLNWRLLTEGTAYLTVYTSTPHRDSLRDAAANARDDGLGVWAEDTSAQFDLRDQESIGPLGQLILPKLFRRCTDYLKAVAEGYIGSLGDWLIWVSTGTRHENDRVVIDERIEVRLSDLIDQRNRTVVFQPDLLEITFVEK